MNRIRPQNRLEACVTGALDEGRALEVVDKLKEMMTYSAAVTGPAPTLEAL